MGGDPGRAPTSALKPDTVVVSNSLMTTVVANLRGKPSCTVSVRGFSYLISGAGQSITGPFESDPSARAGRVNDVLNVAVNAPACKG
jgi:hypothetical protein